MVDGELGVPLDKPGAEQVLTENKMKMKLQMKVIESYHVTLHLGVK